MTGFSADWLDLREKVDARSRSRKLLQKMESTALNILDLAGGTAANLRIIAPMLRCNQHWLIVDNDAALLAAQPERTAAWSLAREYECTVESSEGGAVGDSNAAARFHVRGPDFTATVESCEYDLADGLAGLDIGPGTLVTASALLDLVSDEWLVSAIGAIATARAGGYFALTYDGRIAIAPADPVDGLVQTLVNEHQRSDKGFGAALGPAASRAAARYFQDAGYVVETDTSDWQLDGRDRQLQRALVEGWVDAALEIEPGSRARLGQWQSTRSAQIDRGEVRIRVGHEDLLALPAGWPATVSDSPG